MEEALSEMRQSVAKQQQQLAQLQNLQQMLAKVLQRGSEHFAMPSAPQQRQSGAAGAGGAASQQAPAQDVQPPPGKHAK
jgi:hypothetical protein